MPSWGRFFTSLFLVVVLECLIALGDTGTDVTEGAVIIVFDSVTATAWSKNGTAQRFQKTISEVANGYCSINTAKCSLTSWNITSTFESSNVVIVSGFPQGRDGDLDVKFYVTYPSAQHFSGNIKAVLHASILEEIVLANKRNISNAVGTTVKSVGDNGDDDDDDDDDDKKQTDSFMNYIMIPLTVTLLIILCVLVCCLQYCKNKQVRAHEAERRQQLELTNQTKAPTTQMETVQVVSRDAHRRKKRVKRMKKREKHINEKLDSSDDAPEERTQANGPTAVTWFEDEEQSSTKGKSIKHKHRKHRGSVDQQAEEPREESRDSAEKDSETKEDIETDDVDTRDQPQKRRKVKRKKHRKRYSHQVDDEQRHTGIVLSDSQLSKLPSIRNLPPLKDRKCVEA